ncbi:DUF1796 family putative cysteine peptidase [Paenibacillus sp. DMB5]|uniref:DUF1796 family putative cysteine peptidase n=1 Tax=Paenibacillus sp. DMB5 TaxID=1780103 RepID=UPI00076BEA40|nr:DUF1796 family putative cysteine peptidase [Paenibacillus sp. DMB5]KUP25382.1 hypothetical protein AWJ19_17505 [Paenibacillus sp. DMB5]
MYNSIVSLGWYCATAASLSKNGFRSFSGPFDWCTSEYEGVLHLIESDFKDFLSIENIETFDEKPKEFKDSKYGILYNHDIQNSFAEDFPAIKEKYSRRIHRFLEETKKGVCFIRVVKHQQELEYIACNHNKIHRIITKNNINNTVIYLIPKYMSIPQNFHEKNYILNINLYQGNYREAFIGLFDTVPDDDFILQLKNNYPEIMYKDNLIYYLQSELKIVQSQSAKSAHLLQLQAIKDVDNAYHQINIYENRWQRLMRLHRANFSHLPLPSSIAVYGAGDIGKVFYDKAKDFTNIKCFIDKNPCEKEYRNIPIVKLADYTPEPGTTIIVIPTYAYTEICNDLTSLCDVEISSIAALETVLDSNIFSIASTPFLTTQV